MFFCRNESPTTEPAEEHSTAELADEQSITEPAIRPSSTTEPAAEQTGLSLSSYYACILYSVCYQTSLQLGLYICSILHVN